ncbi:MAG: nicotinate-nucleotide adenylyltransferase [Pseudomonadota bacterium]
MEVAIFGGSFDPPHTAHVLVVAEALASGFDLVVAPVVFSHPFAKDLTPFDHRVAMLRLALDSIPGAAVSDVERTLPAPSYTVQTLEALKRANPTWQMRLIVGSDVLPELDRWQDPKRVAELAPLWVLGRAGHPHPDAPQAHLPDLASSRLRSRLAAAWSRDGTLIKSSLIGDIPLDVLDYIEQHALYR